jgi:hypothetical protein
VKFHANWAFSQFNKTNVLDCYRKKSLKIPKEGNQNLYIEEEKTTQWSKEKVQTDKQRSTNHTYKTKDQVTWTPLKTGGELRCSGRVSSSCSTSDTRRVNLVTHPVISHEQGKDREVLTLHETIIIYSKTANYNYVLLTKNQQILTLVVFDLTWFDKRRSRMVTMKLLGIYKKMIMKPQI